MKKIGNKSFWMGFVIGIPFTFAGLYLVFWIETYWRGCRRSEIVEVNEVDDVDTLLIDDLYMGMTEEEFYKEMQKGVKGDLTWEQYDSLMLTVKLLDHSYCFRFVNRILYCMV